MTRIQLPQGPALVLRLLGLLWVVVGVMLACFKPGAISETLMKAYAADVRNPVSEVVLKKAS